MHGDLVLFVRAPALGRGKRRLARDIGDLAAANFERATIALMLRRLTADRRWRMRVAVTPDRAAAAVRLGRWRIPIVPQGKGDLGARMHRALALSTTRPVVLIGGDIPGIRARHIADAFALLERQDFVFGPAADGGFWLVGARAMRHLPKMFSGVRWSTPFALADTLAALPKRFSAGFAAHFEDVDGGEAYRRLAPRRGF
jgi:rSAM/selenodomain-associated transferase 1